MLNPEVTNIDTWLLQENKCLKRKKILLLEVYQKKGKLFQGTKSSSAILDFFRKALGNIFSMQMFDNCFIYLS